MPKWLLIVGLALVAILSFLLIQGPLSIGPTAPPESSTEQSEQSEQAQQTDQTEGDADEETAEQTETAQPSEQAREIMRQAREAQGGLDALENLTGYRSQVESLTTQRGQTFSLEIENWVRLPNELRQSTVVSVQGQTINSLTVWNGETGWVRQQGQVQELQPNQAGSVQQNLYLNPLHILLYTARGDFTYAYQGTETIGGTETHAIQVDVPQGPAPTYYFDAESFLPIQRMRSAQGTTVRTVFEDYRRVDGYAFPFSQRTFLNDSLAQEQTVTNVEINPSFDSQLFQRPQTDGQQSGE